jgi:hypothetical protein
MYHASFLVKNRRMKSTFILYLNISMYIESIQNIGKGCNTAIQAFCQWPNINKIVSWIEIKDPKVLP